MKIIDGTGAVLGRLASYVAKEALRGEEIVIVNCDEIIISGSKKNIKDEFLATRKRVGSGQQGPKISRDNEKIVKKTIRGMLPNYRGGRGREAFKRIKCYTKVPKELEDKKKISVAKESKLRFVVLKEMDR